MKVLLIKDVYKLGLAGEVKKVATGYGRNYLIPQGLAVLATTSALKTATRIGEAATARRVVLNEEMSGVAERLQGVMLNFPARAGETGKLYGSVTTRMIAESLQTETEMEVDSRQVDSQPIRSLGLHTVDIRLTMDLVPQIQVLVYREGESPATALAAIAAAKAEEALEAESLAEGETLDEGDEESGEVPEMAAGEAMAVEAEETPEAEGADPLPADTPEMLDDEGEAEVEDILPPEVGEPAEETEPDNE